MLDVGTLSAGELATDGDTSCSLNGHTWTHPITVWRGSTFQAENAAGGGFVTSAGAPCTPGTSGCTFLQGGRGYQTNCTPGANNCGTIADTNAGMGKRVGYLMAGLGVQFTKIPAPATTANIIVYYENGDAPNLTRYLSFVVNGGAPQTKAFAGLSDWEHPRGAAVTLTGFTPGSTNTITVTADPIHPAPDLDWIEVVDVNSTVPSTGLCQPAMWNVTTSVNGAIGLPAIVNGILTNRFTSNRAMQVGQYVQIDFTGNVNLSTNHARQLERRLDQRLPRHLRRVHVAGRRHLQLYAGRDGLGNGKPDRHLLHSRSRSAPSAFRRRARSAPAGGRSASSRPTVTSL